MSSQMIAWIMGLFFAGLFAVVGGAIDERRSNSMDEAVVGGFFIWVGFLCWGADFLLVVGWALAKAMGGLT